MSQERCQDILNYLISLEKMPVIAESVAERIGEGYARYRELQQIRGTRESAGNAKTATC